MRRLLLPTLLAFGVIASATLPACAASADAFKAQFHDEGIPDDFAQYRATIATWKRRTTAARARFEVRPA